MPITHQIKFGTLDLTDYIEQHQDSNPTRLSIQAVPKRHGGLVSELPVLDIRKINLRGVVYADKNAVDGPADLRTKLRAIEAALGYTRQKLYMFTDRYFWAYKTGWSHQIVPGTGMLVAAITMEFTCDDPFEYTATDPTPVTQTILASDTVVDVTRQFYKRSFVINSPGSVYAWIKTTVSANQGNAVSRAIVRNLTTVKQWAFTAAAGGLSGIINAAQSLIVDGKFFTVENNGVSDLVNWLGTFVWLQQGDNTIEIEGSKAQYTFEFPERYL
jgi:hypothetical protein